MTEIDLHLILTNFFSSLIISREDDGWTVRARR